MARVNPLVHMCPKVANDVCLMQAPQCAPPRRATSVCKTAGPACMRKVMTSTFSHCLHRQAMRRPGVGQGFGQGCQHGLCLRARVDDIDLVQRDHVHQGFGQGCPVSMGRACVRELMTSISCSVTTCTTSLRFCSSPSGHCTNLVVGPAAMHRICIKFRALALGRQTPQSVPPRHCLPACLQPARRAHPVLGLAATQKSTSPK